MNCSSISIIGYFEKNTLVIEIDHIRYYGFYCCFVQRIYYINHVTLVGFEECCMYESATDSTRICITICVSQIKCYSLLVAALHFVRHGC